jgi:hypothetical protein
MRQFRFSGAVALALLGQAGLAGAADQARALVEQAIAASGGETALRQSRAVYTKLTGVIYEDVNAPFSADLYTQYPDRSKLILTVDLSGQKVTMIQALDRDKAWLRQDDEDTELSAEEINDMHISAHVDNVASLLPLLEDSSYRLTFQGAAEVQGKPAQCVRVSAKGQPDVILFFDKANGLLMKTQYHRREHKKKQDVLKEEYLNEYREVDLVSADVQALKAAGMTADGPALLAYLRDHTTAEDRRESIQGLIRKLGDPSFEKREAAQASLVVEGAYALPLLARATGDADPEVARRAKECLDRIGKPPDVTLPAAIARLLAQVKPPGAVAVLLTYLPSAPDENVIKEIQSALAILAFQGGRLDPAVERASHDPNQERRALALQLMKGDAKAAAASEGQRLFPKGLKHATAGVQYKDGVKAVEWKVTDVQFFTSFGDQVFAKP